MKTIPKCAFTFCLNPLTDEPENPFCSAHAQAQRWQSRAEDAEEKLALAVGALEKIVGAMSGAPSIAPYTDAMVLDYARQTLARIAGGDRQRC